MPLYSTKFIVTSSYAAVGLATYGMVSYILILNKKLFQGSFFKIFLFSAAVNTVTYLNSIVTLRLPQTACASCSLSALFTARHFPGLEVFHTIHYHMAFLQFFVVSAESLNRLSMILFPVNYETFWKKQIKWIFLVMLLLPFAVTYNFLINYSFYEYMPSLDYYAIKTTANMGHVYTCLVTFQITMTIVNAVFNGLTWVLYCKSNHGNTHNSVERQLFFHSFVSFIIESFGATISVFNRLAVGLPADSWPLQTAQLLVPFFSDAITLSPPFILLLCSSQLRRCLRQYFKRNRIGTDQEIKQ